MQHAEKALNEATTIAKQAGEIALRYFGRVVPSVKADNSYVTEADRAVEQFIRRELEKRFPADDILGEEYGTTDRGSAEYTWILDPIDGTTNFVGGLPHWGVCIARARAGKPELGVVCVPPLGEVYAAAAGHGATLNDRSFVIDERVQPPNEQLLAVWSTWHRTIDLHFPGKVRTLGSTAIKCLYAARGTVVGAITPEVHVWDIAAGLMVLWEAGGEARMFDGSLFSSIDVDPANGFIVPPLIMGAPRKQAELRAMIALKG
jgi:myo-inositol-1(or 4)-monophosphatase